MQLNLERLESRDTPSVAFFSNGQLAVFGDTNPVGNIINVSANAGQISVTDRGQPVPIISQTAPPTTANLADVVEVSGYGPGSVLMTDKSLGNVATTFYANGLGSNYILPGNTGPSVAFGAPNAGNFFQSNPGGKDTFVGGGGSAYNIFSWPPGTGTDVYIGAGRMNTVYVFGNANNQVENDSLSPDGQGGVVYSRNNLVPFQIYGEDIQNWVITPDYGPGNLVTIGDLSGTQTQLVAVITPGGASILDASRQLNLNVALEDLSGDNSLLETGAGPNYLISTDGATHDVVLLTRRTDVFDLVYPDPTVTVVPPAPGAGPASPV